jgi:hypothetical protein
MGLFGLVNIVPLLQMGQDLSFKKTQGHFKVFLKLQPVILVSGSVQKFLHFLFALFFFFFWDVQCFKFLPGFVGGTVLLYSCRWIFE